MIINKMLQIHSMQELYIDRLDSAWSSLDEDVKRWKKISTDRIIKHHIDEFDEYKEAAYLALEAKQDKDGDRKIAVVGALTAYWARLREVAAQRLPNSPYLSAIQKLDQQAQAEYHRLRLAFPVSIRDKINKFAPIIHLGATSALTIFDERTPLVLSIPYGAVDAKDDRAQLCAHAIEHEIAHACLLQVPGFLGELKRSLDPIAPSTTRARILGEVISKWSEEIAVDAICAALEREAYTFSAMWITATSVNYVGTGDDQHPPAILRLNIQQEVLENLDKSSLPWQTLPGGTLTLEQLQAFRRTYIANLDVDDLLCKPFQSFPGLGNINLREVKTALLDKVQVLLNTETCFSTLGQKTEDTSFVGLLQRCTQRPPQEPAADSLTWTWGEISDTRHYALEISEGQAALFQTPMMVTKSICPAIFRILRLC